MRTVTLASLRLYTRRYVAAFLAVAIGVAFIVTIGALNASAKEGLTAGVGVPFRGAELVATDVYEPDDATAVVEATRAAGGAAAPVGYTTEGTEAIGVVADDDELRWQTLVAGAWPRAPGEIVVDEQAAKGNGAGVGDEVALAGGEFQVVGVVASGDATMRFDYYALWSGLESLPTPVWTDSVAVSGVDESVVADAAPDAEVLTADAYVQELQTEITRGTDTLTLMLLVFVTVALTVAAIVIANTFSILFAQRTSDIAMLRCVGATRAQVRRSVRLEAAAIGVGSSLVGVLAGLGFGYGIVAAVRAIFSRVPLGAAHVGPAWIAGGFVVGVLVTVAAAWLPTRATTRISPLAALRPSGDVGLRSAAGRIRVTLGVLLLLAGTAGLILAVALQQVVAMLAGGVLAFVSVLVLGPVLVPPLIRGAGRLARPLAGTTARIATDNAVRNPKRTATTASALLVGVTLTSAVVVGMSSARASIDQESREGYPVDAALSATTQLPADTMDRALAVPGVAQVTVLEGASVTIDGHATPLAATPHDTSVLSSTSGLPGEGEIAIPTELMEQLDYPETVTVESPGQRLTLEARTSSYGHTPVVDAATLRDLTDTTVPVAAWLATDPGSAADDLVGDLTAVASSLDLRVHETVSQQHFIDQQMTVMTAVVIGLLGIAVLIALVGIGSTLGLSVLERRRENALLRALGVTRRQLRATLAVEAILLAGAAAVLGVAIGTLFGWIGVEVLIGQLSEHASLVVPAGQLAAIVALAAGAGVLASVLPSRRAARIAPAAGLTPE